MKIDRPFLQLCVVVFVVTAIAVSAAQAAKPPSPFAPIEEDASLPRVLVIGDSISIGYTLAVRAELKEVANVLRIPTNGGPTIRGVESIEKWLGDGKWDLIHFNWGLHDLKYIDGVKQVPLDQYKVNLEKLVVRMKKTGATLIWCSTTPVPPGCLPPRKNEDVLAYNAAAAEIMAKHGVATDDLYTFANGRLTEIQREANVHFLPEGSKVLGKEVARVIKAALKKAE